MSLLKRNIQNNIISPLKRAEERIINNELKYISFIEHGADGMAILTPEGKPLYISRSVKQVLGYTVKEAMQLSFFTCTHPADISAFREVFHQSIAAPTIPVKGNATRMRHKNGTWRWIEAVMTNMLHNAEIRGVINNFRDVTEKKLAEDKLICSIRLHAFISKINQSLARSKSVQMFFEEVCKIAVNTGKFKMAWISSIHEQDKKLHLEAHYNLAPEDIEILQSLFYNERESAAEVIKNNECYIINDFKTEFENDENKQFALLQGFGSGIVLPLKKAGKTIFALNLFDAAVNFFESEEVILLKAAADDISFALDVFEEEKLKSEAEDKLKLSELHLNQAQATGIYCITPDITAMKEAEAALRESESNLQAIFENTSEGFILTDLNGIIKSFNSKSLETIRLNTEQEIKVGESIFDFVHPSRKDNYKDLVKKVLSGETLKYDYAYTRKNGETKWFDFTVNPVYKTGKITGISITSADITQRKQAEQRLLESETFNKGILASLTSHIAVVDKSGTIVAVNEAWANYGKANGAISPDYVSAKSNYFDVCKKAIEAGEIIAEQTLNGIYSVLNKEKQSFNLEYPCHSPTEKRWFNVHVSHFGDNDSKVVISHQDVTQRKISEKALRQSETNLQAFFENTSEGLVLTDINGEIRLFNNKAKEIFLWNSGKVLAAGASIFDFVRESMKETYQSAIPKAISGEDLEYDIPIQKENGEVRWFVFTITRVIRSGLIDGFSITAKDITERKQIEELLKRSESNLNAVIENTDAFIYSLDKDFRYITFNNALKKMMRELYGINITPGYNVFDYIREFEPERLQEWNDVYSKALNGKVVKFEKKFVIGDQCSYTSFSIHPIWENKDVIGLSCFVHDVTKEKQAEEAIKQSEFRYRQIVETAQEGIWMIDRDDKTTFVNQKMCEIIGYSQEEMMGKTNLFFKDEEGLRQGINNLKRRRQGIAETYNSSFITKDGRLIWTKVSSNPIFDNTTEYKGSLCMISDITEILQAEKMLRESEQKYRDLTFKLQAESTRLNEAQAVAKIGSWETELETLHVNWSQETYRIFETDPFTFAATHQAFLNFIPADDRAKVDAAFRDSFSKDTFHSIEHRIITAKGNEKFVVENWEVFNNEKGIPVRASGTCQDITERKKDELKIITTSQELQKTLADLKKIMDLSLDIIITFDEEGRFVTASAASESVWGYKPDELIGRKYMDFVFTDDKDKTTITNDTIRNGEPVTMFENKYVHKDGRIIPMYWSSRWDSNDKLFYSIARDATEKKKLEDLLAKTNRLVGLGRWEVDLLNKTCYMSAITKEIHEVDYDYVPDIETAIDFYKSGSSRNSINNAVKTAIDNGTPYDLQLQIITAKGNERWVRTTGSAEHTDGKCVRLYGSFQDIDKIKKAEIEILKVYEEKNTILESIGDAFFAVDKNWTVTYWNNQAEKILNTSKNKIMGCNLWEVFTNMNETKSYKNYHQAIGTKQVIRFEDYYNALDKWFDISAYPSATGLSVFFKDITQQKKLEEERTKMTADIVQRNNDLDQFSYIVSHNLRAPVANIIGLTAELTSDDNNTAVKEIFLKELCTNADKLDKFIIDLNSILQVKREISEKKETVDLARLIDSIQLSIQNLIQKEQVQIKTDFTEVNEFTAIKSYLHSIFYNLISNSIKYRQADLSPVIEIKTARYDRKLIISFKDNGTGIDLEKKGDQVFGLYKRFHKNIEGKGMGLFIVKTQVETLGGEITVKSEINKGTEFKLEFEI